MNVKISNIIIPVCLTLWVCFIALYVGILMRIPVAAMIAQGLIGSAG